ncbi:unnamed protein product [Parajaminaea phylloscopi]
MGIDPGATVGAIAPPLASPRAALNTSSVSRPATPSSAGSSSVHIMGNGSHQPVTIEQVKRWGESDVAAWLASYRVGQHSHTFARNDITGQVLLDVDQSALKEMGITAVGDRIRIFSAIKALRKQCMQAAQHASSRSFMEQARMIPPEQAHPSATSPLALEGGIDYMHGIGAEVMASPVSPHASGSSRKNSQSRPPPLRLSGSASSNIPATPPAYPSPSAGSTFQGLGLSQARGLTPGNSHRGAPNPANVGQGRSPLPANFRNLDASGTRSASPAPTHRKTNSAVPGTFNQQQQRGNASAVQQRAFGSYGGQGTASASGRPSTAGNMKLGAFSGLNASSPTNAVFNGRPGTADPAYEQARGGPGSSSSSSSLSGVSAVGPGNTVALSPITEAKNYSPTTSSAAAGLSGFHLNRGKPIQASAYGAPYSTGPSSSAPSGSSAPPPPTLEDLKRRTIKFIGDDGTTRTVNVSDCRDAYEVLARVLKKFGKPSNANSYPPDSDRPLASPTDGYTSDPSERYVIVATSSEGATRDLKPEELLAICHAPQPYDPLRERGLTLRKVSAGPQHDLSASRRIARSGRNKLEAFFGERVTSEGPSTTLAQGGQFLSEDPHAHQDLGHVTTAGKRMNRASTVSIMSGLGAGAMQSMRGGSASPVPAHRGIPNRASISAAAAAATAAAEAASARASIFPRRARNFMGQRPPSELISSHLADYFPATEKRLLERTARRSIYGRASSSIHSSKRDSTWSFNAVAEKDELPPPLPTKSYDGGAPTLPPVVGRSSLDDWSKQLQTVGSDQNTPAAGRQLDVPESRPRAVRRISSGRASIDSSRSRKSYAAQLRAARGLGSSGPGPAVDRSDAASMLTVDEITQEVENRRESMSLAEQSQSGWVVDEDGVPIPIPAGTRTRKHRALTGGDVSSMVTVEEDSARPSSGIQSDIDGGSPMEDERRATSMSPNSLARRQSSDPDTSAQSATDNDDEESASWQEAASGVDDLDSSSQSPSDEEGEDEDEGPRGAMTAPTSAIASGKQPIKWIQGALIGAGSFGSVYLGMNAKNGLLMAVKRVELPSGQSQNDQKKKRMLDALEGEIELLKTLQHENIVQYLDSYGDGTHLNIFLEYVPGGSVVALLRNYGAFEEPLVRNFVRQILNGLSFLHNKDIIHRDIKGANILVDNKSCIKISDFGISKKVESDLLANARAHRPSLQGSVFWMAPEVVKQTSYSRKADIWSLGCLVVEMMSGTHPWPNLNQMQALFKIGSASKPSLPEEISSAAVDFLNKTFEIDHNLRPSAEDLLQHAFITEDFVPLDSAAEATASSSSTHSVANTSADGTGSTASAPPMPVSGSGGSITVESDSHASPSTAHSNGATVESSDSTVTSASNNAVSSTDVGKGQRTISKRALREAAGTVAANRSSSG